MNTIISIYTYHKDLNIKIKNKNTISKKCNFLCTINCKFFGCPSEFFQTRCHRLARFFLARIDCFIKMTIKFKYKCTYPSFFNSNCDTAIRCLTKSNPSCPPSSANLSSYLKQVHKFNIQFDSNFSNL